MQRLAALVAGTIAGISSLGACHAAPAPAAAPASPSSNADDDTDDPEDPSDQLPTVSATAGTPSGAALLAEAQRELAAVQSSHYEHHSHVDESHGLFDFDCSGFVGYALSRVAPDALHAIQAQSQPRPLAKHFEAVFAAAPAAGPWQRIERATDLAPGDVIAWIEPPAKHSRNTGHVMIVAGALEPAPAAGELVVPVIDSSHSGHGTADARVRDHRNGLGAGSIVLLLDANSHPIGYRWSTWKHSKPYRTEVTLGRLRI